MVGRAERDRVLEWIRGVCLGLPETSERLSHGAPTFFVRGKRAEDAYVEVAPAKLLEAFGGGERT